MTQTAKEVGMVAGPSTISTVNLFAPLTTDPPAVQKLKQELADAYARGERLYLLNPRHYAAAGVANHWSAQFCNLAMKAILPLFMMRITYDTVISLDGTSNRLVHVGEGVPKARFATIMLRMKPEEQDEHNRQTDGLLQALNIGTDEEQRREVAIKDASAQQVEVPEGEGMIDNGLFRLLKHCTLDPNLAKLTVLNHANMTDAEKSEKAKEARNSWASVDNDCGASFFYARTRDSPKYAIPGDRITLAYYLCALSVKIRYTLLQLKELVLRRREKVILMHEFPTCLWYVFVFFLC